MLVINSDSAEHGDSVPCDIHWVSPKTFNWYTGYSGVSLAGFGGGATGMLFAGLPLFKSPQSRRLQTWQLGAPTYRIDPSSSL